jgi:hypothetical protein
VKEASTLYPKSRGAKRMFEPLASLRLIPIVSLYSLQITSVWSADQSYTLKADGITALQNCRLGQCFTDTLA